jgi:hypothetical protein
MEYGEAEDNWPRRLLPIKGDTRSGGFAQPLTHDEMIVFARTSSERQRHGSIFLTLDATLFVE